MRTHSGLGGLAATAMIALGLLLGSCATPPPATTSEEAIKETKPYGSLRVATLFGTGQIDPQAGSLENFQAVGQAFFDTLLRYDDSDVLIPGIAERWEIAPDGLSHTFYIRRGVKFHNGDDLIGADVKFSIERMLAPESAQSHAAIWRPVVAGVQLKDDYTVVLQFKQPQFDILISVDGGMGAIAPKKYVEEKGVDYFRKNPVGSGPWRFVSFEPGSRLELEAVESHWRVVPKFRNITLLNISEESTKVAMLKTGELDMALVAPDSVAGLKAAGRRMISFDRGPQYFVVPFYDVNNPEKYALGDVRVRKALQLAINAKEIADKLLGGYGGPYVMYNVPPTAFFFDPNVLKVDPYDPEGAKKLLAEAGYPSGFDTRLYDVGGGDLLSTIDQALAGYWRKIGVNVEMVPMDFNSFRPRYNPRQTPEIWNSLWAYRSFQSRHFDGMRSGYHSTSSFSKNLKNPRLDELINLVPSTKDPAEKKRLALEAAVLAKNSYAILTPVTVYPTVAVSGKIGELKSRVRNNYIDAVVYEGTIHAK